MARRPADPLEINALRLVVGGRQSLLISFDLLYIGGSLEQRLRHRLRERHGLADGDILLFASHTHFAPPTDPTLPELGPYDAAYAARIEHEALDLADEAMRAAPRPARVEFRRGTLAHSVNRRRPRSLPIYTRSGGLTRAKITFAPYEAGPRDDTATIVSLVDAQSGTPLACLWHFACHPVSHTPPEVTSADFPGVGRRALRAVAAGRDMPVLFLQGFCGDIRPNIEAKQPDDLRGRLKDLITEILAGTRSLQPSEHSWLQWSKTFGERITDIAASQPQAIERPTALTSECRSIDVRDFFEGTVNRSALTIRGLRLGDFEILAIGAEPSTNWQRHLNAAIGEPSGVRLFAGYCGDVIGYLPLPHQIDEGGYEVLASQHLFGLRGRYRPRELDATVTGAFQALSQALRDSEARSGERSDPPR